MWDSDREEQETRHRSLQTRVAISLPVMCCKNEREEYGKAGFILLWVKHAKEQEDRHTRLLLLYFYKRSGCKSYFYQVYTTLGVDY